jgi:hypothetical protein
MASAPTRTASKGEVYPRAVARSLREVCSRLAPEGLRTTTAGVIAVEHIRRMRGGSQPQFMRCSDDNYYVVKFLNNPQGARILFNELFGARLAQRLGLPVAHSEIIDVPETLIRGSEEMYVEMRIGRTPCQPGPCFGSRFPGDPCLVLAYDLLPFEKLLKVQNLSDFLGMLVFDKWTCNLDRRQTVFFRDGVDTPYNTVMIDQGFCFGGSDWRFNDAPLLSRYCREIVYEPVTGMKDFEPWLQKLESLITEKMLVDAAGEIPQSWYGSGKNVLDALLECLYRRRTKVAELLWSLRRTSPELFPAWVDKSFSVRGMAAGF